MARSFTYALSLQYGPDNPSAFLADYPGGDFPALEIPGPVLSHPGFDKYRRQAGINRLHLTETMDLTLTRSIAEQSFKFIEEFKRKLAEVLDKAIEARIRSITMDFAFGGTWTGAFYERRVKLLKAVLPILYERDIILCLPVRCPYEVRELPQHYLRLLTELLSPSFRICLDVYPHSLARDYSPAEMLRWLKFDLELIRFIYEPEIGNRLVNKQVQPWLEYLERFAFLGMVVFAPHISGTEFYLNEGKKITRLLGDAEPARGVQ